MQIIRPPTANSCQYCSPSLSRFRSRPCKVLRRQDEAQRTDTPRTESDKRNEVLDKQVD